jgi:hypothetical protein
MSRDSRRMTHRHLLTIVLAAAVWLTLTSTTMGAQTWRIDSASNTAVAPGDTLEYLVQPANVGDTDMDGSQIDVDVRLDPALTAVDGVLLTNVSNNFPTRVPCTAGDGGPLAGASTVRCSTTEPLAAAINAQGIDYIVLKLTVRADPLASGTLMSTFQVSGGGAPPVRTVDATKVSDVPPGFGVDAFDGVATASPAGDPLTQAGGHPYDATVSIDFNTITNPVPLAGSLYPVEPVKDVFVDLPPGLVGNPASVDQCRIDQLANGVLTSSKPLCPSTSQVGTTMLMTNGATPIASPFGPVPVFNMVPPPNVPARFGFSVLGAIILLDARLRSDGDYGLTVDAREISEALAIAGSKFTFWGVPADSSHDAERSCPNFNPPAQGGPSCRSGAPRRTFLRNPTSCPGPDVGLTTTAHIDSWEHPGDFVDASWTTHLLPGYPFPPEMWGPMVSTTGCSRVPFDPTLAGTPATPAKTASPSGFSFDLSLPQTDDPDVAIGESDLKRAEVTLPEGVRVSPSSASGLEACSPAEIGLHSTGPARCPDGSKVGEVTVETPLLDDPLSGAVYLAKQNDNPFGSLLAIYIVANGPGVVVKLAGHVEADPVTGQLTTTFDDNPQLPFSNLHLEFKGGPRAPLVTPRQCGTYVTHAVLTGWSGKVVETDSPFTLSHDGHGAPCPAPRFAPHFSAGTQNPVGGRASPLSLSISRDEEDDDLAAVTVNMPRGLTGKIANVELCPEQAAKAGSCSDASRIGRVTVGAGAGTSPFYIDSGRAYLTGPYRGAPFGIAIVVPAVAGPFNLGDVVVRSAIFVDKHTADLRVVSDPLPHILQGIPLDVRDVRVVVDRPNFILNPTSCSEKTISGVLTSTEGRTANVSSRFQAGNCAGLTLKPRMVVTAGTTGLTNRGSVVPLSTTLTMPPGGTNLRFVRVTLPKVINARLTVINRACSRDAFEAGRCEDARAGTAAARTPLLRDPLHGNVYFVKNGHALPDLFISLRGQVEFDLIGRISIPGSTRLATTFDAVPDVPVSSFSLKLISGSKGSVGAAMNLCSSRGRSSKAELDYIGQNGRVTQVDQRLKVRGCPAHGRKGGKKAGHRHR